MVAVAMVTFKKVDVVAVAMVTFKKGGCGSGCYGYL